MDKINLRYKFPPDIITGSAEDKAEFLDLLAKLKINDAEELQAIFSRSLIAQDMFITYDASDNSMVKSLIVENASDELVSATYDRFNTLLTYFPKHRGGILTINTEKDISYSTDYSLSEYSQSNILNNLLPTQSLFSYFSSLKFLIDDNKVNINTNEIIEEYYNDGRISILGEIDEVSWYNYKSVYGRLTTTTRLIEPSFHLVIDNTTYAEFKNQTGKAGIPFIVDAFDNTLINEEYFKIFIDQITDLIDAGKHLPVLPIDVIKLENRLRDSSGYYFKYIKFGSTTIGMFVNNQIDYLSTILNTLTQITNKESVINYARSQWLQ
jgi:hypothetical protein